MTLHLHHGLHATHSKNVKLAPMTDLRTLVNQARGGRVVRTGFLESADLDRRALAAGGVKFAAHGGFTDASRVMYTLYPEHIPAIDDPVRVLQLEAELPSDVSTQDIRVALGLPDELRGDIRQERGAFLIATNAKGAKLLEERTSLNVQGRPLEVRFVPADSSSLGRGSKTRSVVVPSLRLDVVGAKGFGVSRAYFQAGIEGKKVRVNGVVASNSTGVREGDTLSAEGLGRIEFKRIEGETRRGNVKLELEVHR
jgi:RNA-binding protein YlmH